MILLTTGETPEQIVDGDKKSFTMQYIDWKHPENNVFHVNQEFAVTRTEQPRLTVRIAGSVCKRYTPMR